ncbi:MAG: glycosyltransferase family 2 protein [Chloroflexi bacterium]|nr:glycosyltransferase family 2 protein [Chloroflexota bacterium]
MRQNARDLNAPTVSVCIPTFNHVHLLADAIESVLRQDYTDFELVVSDNASSDGTPQRVGRYQDPRIRYVRSERNLGFVANLQRCLTLACGQFVLFVCDDDVIRPDLLAQQVAFFQQQPQAVFVHTGHDIVSRDLRLLERRIYPWPLLAEPREFRATLLKLGIAGICLSSAMVQRAAAHRVGGFDMRFEFSPDFAMWINLSGLGPIGYLAQPLVLYRSHGESLTATARTSASDPLGLVELLADWCRAERDPEILEAFDRALADALALRTRALLAARARGRTLRESSREFGELARRYPRIWRRASAWLFLAALPLPHRILAMMRHIAVMALRRAPTSTTSLA